MRWTLLALALIILGVGIVVAATTAGGGDRRFTSSRAEATVRRALERCDHELSDARRIVCERAGRGFACRADGQFVASFRRPDPESPMLSVTC